MGTAQFGLNYGITNQRGKVATGKAREILEAAADSGIFYIDTAQSYGDSETVLGKAKLSQHRFKIISKLSAQSSARYVLDDIEHWEDSFQRSRERLGVETLDSYLLHHAADLSKPGFEYLLEWLTSLKRRGMVKRIGISAYDACEISKVDPDVIDIVQIPLSLYDQRLLDDGTIDKLHNLGISVHVRSCLLQGLLVTPAHTWPNWAKIRWKDHHVELETLAHKRGCTLMDMALNFISNQAKIEAVVFGVCSVDELQSFLVGWGKKNAWLGTEWRNWSLDDPELLDPRQWPK
jgi:aryl-alcohol dehydrogenase-like predicted oxidoreductase